jgi:hypothetical protein
MAIPLEGLLYAHKVAWLGGSQEAAWYGNLGGASNYTPAADDAMANIASRAGEYSTEISEANRPVWTPDTTDPATPVSDNGAARMEFTAASIVDVWTFIFTSSPTKQGDTGVLGASFKLASSRHLEATDQLLVRFEKSTVDST